MKTGTIVGIVAVVAAIGVGAFVFWPRKGAAAAVGTKTKSDAPANVLDQATGYLKSAAGLAKEGNALYDQLSQLGVNLGLGDGAKKQPGANTTAEGTADKPPFSALTVHA